MKGRAKILLIFTEFPPKFGGMQTHAVEMAAYLSKYYEVIVYTYKSLDLKEEAKAFDDSVQYQVKRMLSRVSFYANIEKLKQEILEEQPQLIYSSTIYYGILRGSSNIPVVCRSVGNDLLRPWIIYPYKLGSKLLNNWVTESVFYYMKRKVHRPPTIDILLAKERVKLAKQCAKQASLILGNSQYTQNVFYTSGIQNCKVISGGVDHDKFKKPATIDTSNLREELNLNQDSFIIMTASRFVQKKGLDFLIESFQKLESEFKNLELIIIGDGPMKSKLLQLNTSARIHFLGRKSSAELPNYYWASDLFVLCSREIKNEKTGYIDAETMGRVLCEANAASLPVLASNSGGISSIITHDENGLLYETDDFESFTTNLKALIINNELRLKLIENGKKKSALSFDWKVLLKEHLSIFEKLIS